MTARRRSGHAWPVVVACVAVTFPRFVLDRTEAIQPMPVPTAAVITVVWCLPLLWLLRGARTPLVVWAGSAAYVVISALSLAATYRSTHSTAAFGVLFVPLYLATGVAAVLAVERVVARGRSGG